MSSGSCLSPFNFLNRYFINSCNSFFCTYFKELQYQLLRKKLLWVLVFANFGFLEEAYLERSWKCICLLTIFAKRYHLSCSTGFKIRLWFCSTWRRSVTMEKFLKLIGEILWYIERKNWIQSHSLYMTKFSLFIFSVKRYDTIKTCRWNFFKFSWVVDYSKICKNQVKKQSHHAIFWVLEVKR